MVEPKENIMLNLETHEYSISKYRKLLQKVIDNPPKNIFIEDVSEEGNLRFSVNLNEIGLTNIEYKEFDNEVFSYFIVDFLGELMIRDNLHLFVKKLEDIDLSTIDEKRNHVRFGIVTKNGKLIFKFHITLLKSIITENLREIL